MDKSWTMDRCANHCGSPNCDKYWPGPGSWVQGSGYTKEDAERVLTAVNKHEALLRCVAKLRQLNEALDNYNTRSRLPDYVRKQMAEGNAALRALDQAQEGGK